MSFSWGRLGAWALAVIVGAVYGVAGTMTHESVWGVLPVGLIVALVGCLAILVAVRILTGDRIAAVAAGVGMGLVTYVLTLPGPGGSVVMPNDVLSLVWSVGLAGAIVIVIAWPSHLPIARRVD